VRVEFEPTDMTTFNFPTFREQDSSKWKTKIGVSLKDWNAKNKSFQNEVENMIAPGTEPFVDGTESIGLSMIAREPDRTRDISPAQFSGIIPADNHWRSQLLLTNSIRSQKSIEASLHISKPKRLGTVYNLPMIEDKDKERAKLLS
jgi:hypothetical protein